MADDLPPGFKPISSVVYYAIMNAAARTGADSAVMLACADIDSSFDPAAQASNSTAAGLYQIPAGTYQRLVQKYGNRYNVAYNSQFDPHANALLGGQLIQDNAALLRQNGLVSPDAGQLYVMHFMGSTAGIQLLKAAQSTPDADASLSFPQAAAANPGAFLGKTVLQVVNNLSTLANTKAKAYAGQNGLPAPGDRVTGTQAPPANINRLKFNQQGYIGNTQSSVSLLQVQAGLGATSTWTRGSPDPANWQPGQPVAVFEPDGTFARRTDTSSHAGLFIATVPAANGQLAYQILDQWVGRPASMRILYPDASLSLTDNASAYAAINIRG